MADNEANAPPAANAATSPGAPTGAGAAGPLVVASLWPGSVGLLLLLNTSGMVYQALIGALPFFGAALLGWVMLNHHPTERTRTR
jgi:hypothetical protein